MKLIIMIDFAAAPATRRTTPFASSPRWNRHMPASRLAAALLAAVVAAAPALALAEEGRRPIQDNSFLIEEAYNQEPGVIQHIGNFQRSLRNRAWTFAFTEEWPVLGQTHQASLTFVAAGTAGEAMGTGLGDLALNYRWQALGDGDSVLALSPRLTLLLPTGDASRGLGTGGVGLQVNLPLSAVLARSLVTHLNLGATYVPSAWASASESAPLTGFAAGQSLVWLAHERLNFLVEALYTRTDLHARAGTQRSESLTLNPGLRAAFDFASGLQIVPGASLPIGVGPSQGELGVFFYLSFEHPFRPAGPQAERS